MRTTGLAAVAVPLFLASFALQPTDRAAPPAQDSYQVHCEVWSAVDTDLVSAIEAQDAGAVAVLEGLRASSGGAERLLRVLSPVDQGAQARFESLSEKPMVSITSTGGAGGRTQEHFAGYTSTGTSVLLSCRAGAAEGSVTTTLSLEVSGFTDQEATDAKSTIPPGRRTVEVHCDAAAASGELRMLQFQTQDPGTLVVFLRASAL